MIKVQFRTIFIVSVIRFYDESVLRFLPPISSMKHMLIQQFDSSLTENSQKCKQKKAKHKNVEDCRTKFEEIIKNKIFDDDIPTRSLCSINFLLDLIILIIIKN